jgi:hypothetical protein
MMKKNGLMFLALAVCIAPLSLHAGLFGWMEKKDTVEPSEAVSTNAVKRLHLTISDKAAEKELLQLTGVKRILFQERQVLMILQEEKRKDLGNYDAELAKSFGIIRDRNYRYDPKAMTIIEELKKNSTATNAPEAITESRVVKKLESESDSRKFASLAVAKQIAQEDLVVLARLAREKEAALARVDNSFKEKFSMSRDRNYWYDSTTMRLYEIVKPSSKGVIQ